MMVDSLEFDPVTVEASNESHHGPGNPEVIRVEYPAFTPFNISLHCDLPDALNLRQCSENPNSICDPTILVFKDYIQVFNSSDYKSFMHMEPTLPWFHYQFDQSTGNFSWFRAVLQFSGGTVFRNIGEHKLQQGLYSFRIVFEDILSFDPHHDKVPSVFISANKRNYEALAGFDKNCRITESGTFEYRGQVSSPHCPNSGHCLRWDNNIPPIGFNNTFPEYFNYSQANSFCRNPPLSYNPQDQRARPCLLFSLFL